MTGTFPQAAVLPALGDGKVHLGLLAGRRPCRPSPPLLHARQGRHAHPHPCRKSQGGPHLRSRLRLQAIVLGRAATTCDEDLTEAGLCRGPPASRPAISSISRRLTRRAAAPACSRASTSTGAAGCCRRHRQSLAEPCCRIYCRQEPIPAGGAAFPCARPRHCPEGWPSPHALRHARRGQVGLVLQDGPRMSGVHDPRSDGVAIGLM